VPSSGGDFDAKAPTGTDILKRIKTGAYQTKPAQLGGLGAGHPGTLPSIDLRLADSVHQALR
jgi:hypothetical protein